MKKYETYKDSGVEWIGDIPEHWDVKKFKYCFELITSKEDSNLIQIGLEHIESKTGKINYYKTSYESDGIKFKINDILFGKLRPYLAKVWLADFEGQAVGDFFVFRAKQINAELGQKIILSDAFIELCNSSTFGAKMPRVGWEFISNISLPVSDSLAEQKSIAQYLDQKTTIIDNLLQITKQKITTLQEQRTAIINQAVTKGLTHLPPAEGGTKGVPLKDSGVEWIGKIPEHWLCPKLKLMCQVKDGTHDTPEYIDSGKDTVPLITSNYFNNGKIEFEKAKHISLEAHKEIYKRSNVAMDDIIMSMIGSNIGNLAYVNVDFEFSIKNVALFKTSTSSKLRGDFLLYLLVSNQFYEQTDTMQKGGGQKFLSLSDLRNLRFSIPEKKEQDAIANYLNQKTTELDTLLLQQQQRINLLKEYRQSLIAEVVTGKLCVLNEIPIT